MNFKYKALLLFIILLLGLILCSFLGGNCGITHREGFSKNNKSSSEVDYNNLNTIATYYGPDEQTAQIVENSNNSYSIVVTKTNIDCSNNHYDSSVNSISLSNSNNNCENKYTVYHSNSKSSSYLTDNYYGTNGGIARIINLNNRNTSIEITLPDKSTELFTLTEIPSFSINNLPKFNSWPTTKQQKSTYPSSQTDYDNYNHYSGLSISTVYYGPNGATAKVVETANSYNVIVTYPNGQTVIYTANTNVSPSEIYVTVYYGANGGKAVFVTDNNGNKAIQITMPNGNTYLFTVTNQQTYNPDYINQTGYSSNDTYAYPSTEPTSTTSTETANITSTIYYGPGGETARVVQANNSYIIIVTYPDGQTAVYTSNSIVTPNIIYVTVYYGAYGGKAIFINNNGVYTLQITTPNGNVITFNTTPTTSTTPNQYSSQTIPPVNTYPSSMGSSMGSSYGYNYSDSLPPGIPASQIPPGSEDLYILKSEVVPPVCPACPTLPCNIQSEKETCPPCPACERCPQPNFECKKVPNYEALAEEYIPVPVLNDFSQFGM
jgi:hypothetical protein